MFISVYSNGCLLIFTHNWTHVDMKFISHNGTITSQNSDISYWITLYITNYQIKFFLLKQAPNYEELSGRWGVAPAILGVGQRTVSLVCLLMPEKDSPPPPYPSCYVMYMTLYRTGQTFMKHVAITNSMQQSSVKLILFQLTKKRPIFHGGRSSVPLSQNSTTWRYHGSRKSSPRGQPN